MALRLKRTSKEATKEAPTKQDELNREGQKPTHTRKNYFTLPSQDPVPYENSIPNKSPQNPSTPTTTTVTSENRSYIPAEVICNIASYLDEVDLACFRAVNSRIRQVIGIEESGTHYHIVQMKDKEQRRAGPCPCTALQLRRTQSKRQLDAVVRPGRYTECVGAAIMRRFEKDLAREDATHFACSVCLTKHPRSAFPSGFVLEMLVSMQIVVAGADSSMQDPDRRLCMDSINKRMVRPLEMPAPRGGPLAQALHTIQRGVTKARRLIFRSYALNDFQIRLSAPEIIHRCKSGARNMGVCTCTPVTEEAEGEEQPEQTKCTLCTEGQWQTATILTHVADGSQRVMRPCGSRYNKSGGVLWPKDKSQWRLWCIQDRLNPGVQPVIVHRHNGKVHRDWQRVISRY